MNSSRKEQKYLAFLRGINVGGHHKVPMADLKKLIEKMGFSEIQTLLNSGNIIFNGEKEEESNLEKKLADQLEKKFGFSIPVLVRKPEDVQAVLATDPFKDIDVTKDIRLYITFIKEIPSETPDLPWTSEDGSFKILSLRKMAICSVLDVSKTKTPDAMKVLEKYFSKDITTRNVNTIHKMLAKV